MRPTLINQLRLLVPVKRTIDYAVKIRVNAQQTGVETNGVKHSMNPFDEIAVEEAVRLRERMKEKIEKIVTVTIAPKKGGQEVLRTSLAMGSDEAIHVETSDNDPMVEPLTVAKILKIIAKRENIDLIICGKQAIDDDSSQVGGMLSGLLDWSQAQFASKIEISQGETHLQVDREIDGGLETLKVPLPAVVTTDLRLNEPRYASLPNIMKAKKKKITTLTAKDLDIDLTPRLKTLKVEAPPTRQGGSKVEDVDAVIAKLKEAGAL